MTNDEINRRISELRGWKYGLRDEHAPNYRDNVAPCWWYEGFPYSANELPNWTGDEAANAVLLEEMLCVMLEHAGSWSVSLMRRGLGDYITYAVHDDRKTAVALAYIAFMENK